MSISIIITWTKPDLVCSSLQFVVKCLRLLEVALNVLHVTKCLELFHLLGIAFQLLNETLPTQLHIRLARLNKLALDIRSDTISTNPDRHTSL